jgi:hypothetical protein
MALNYQMVLSEEEREALLVALRQTAVSGAALRFTLMDVLHRLVTLKEAPEGELLLLPSDYGVRVRHLYGGGTGVIIPCPAGRPVAYRTPARTIHGRPFTNSTPLIWWLRDRSCLGDGRPQAVGSCASYLVRDAE